MKSYKWTCWLFAIAIFASIKFFECLGFDRGDINQVLFFSGIIIFFAGMLFLLIKSIRLDKKSKESNARINEGLKELERINKE